MHGRKIVRENAGLFLVAERSDQQPSAASVIKDVTAYAVEKVAALPFQPVELRRKGAL